MHSDQAILHVGSGSHFLRAAHQHPHLAGTDFAEQFLLFRFRIRVMDKGDFLRWNAPGDQLRLDIIVDIEAAVIRRRGHIAEQKLRQFFLLPVLPDGEHLIHAGVYLASWIIRQHGVHQPLVKADLPTVRSDFQHVIYRRIDAAAVNFGRTLGKRLYHILLNV